MFGKIIQYAIIRLTRNKRYRDFAHEWIYIRETEDFVKSYDRDIFSDRLKLYDSIIKNKITDESINFLEFGVFKGDSIKYWAEHVSHPEAVFVGFDTFSGLPEDWSRMRPKGSYTTHGEIPKCNDERIRFIKGLFQDTLREYLNEGFDNSRRNVIHLDADLYSSTMYVLSTMLPLLKKGDILIFDEFGYNSLHEYRAFNDFVKMSGTEAEPLGATKGCEKMAFEIQSTKI